MTLAPVLLVAAGLLAASPALAQTAPPPADPAATPPSEQPAVPSGPDAAQIAAHKDVLEKTIAGMKAGKTDYAAMTPELAAKVRASEAGVAEALATMGRLQSLEYVGLVQGALKFRATFEQATTTWFIALGPDGKIVFLVLRAG